MKKITITVTETQADCSCSCAHGDAIHESYTLVSDDGKFGWPFYESEEYFRGPEMRERAAADVEIRTKFWKSRGYDVEIVKKIR